MLTTRRFILVAAAMGLLWATAADRLYAAKVTIDLGNAEGVTLVGAIARWDEDGNLRRLPDQKAKIDAPELDATALNSGKGQWVFADLKPGKYDLLILAAGQLRVEGFQFAPVKEFDPFLPPDATLDEEARQFVLDDIKNSQHFENKVMPLYLTGDKKVIRVLLMLIRDAGTTYTKGAGTIRHELWQYSFSYGGWQKEKRTRVLDRILLPVSELNRWTWLWDAKLGGIEVARSPLAVKYALPTKSGELKLKGLVSGEW